MIPFCKPTITDLETGYMAEAARGKLCGDGPYTKKATTLFCEKQGVANALMITSGTHALELAALLCDIEPGDEVILYGAGGMTLDQIAALTGSINCEVTCLLTQRVKKIYL